ncbi:MAG: CD3324 family protein [Eubacteriales bacterium]|nr:CD3324 family protein [Eubacteriales bacterium]
MSYVKASDVLPEELISEIQKYIDGQMLYVPRKCEEHSNWGERSGIRKKLEKRDKQIFDGYVSGKTILDLSEEYYLSEKSIQRIIRKMNPSENTQRIRRDYN